MVSEIVVTHCDRPCRDLIYSPDTTKLVVLFNNVTSDEHELSQNTLQSTQSLSECKEEELLFTDENAKLGGKAQDKHQDNISTQQTINASSKRKKALRT